MAQDGKNRKHFFKEFKAELKKVIWPTPKQIINGTIAVITIVLIAALIVFALDSVFNLFNQKGIDRLKETILNKDQVIIDEGSEPDIDFDIDASPDDGEIEGEDENNDEEAE